MPHAIPAPVNKITSGWKGKTAIEILNEIGVDAGIK